MQFLVCQMLKKVFQKCVGWKFRVHNLRSELMAFQMQDMNYECQSCFVYKYSLNPTK